MSRKKDVRKSDFVEVLSSEGADHFDLVRNGQNFKITQANLVSDFGASGPLQQRGEITATPVLTVISAVNYIRNLLGGSGITTSLSAGDGVQIDHNFTVNKDGVPVVENEGGDSPVIRSIQTGPGLNVSGSSGVIDLTLTGTPASTKSIVVYTIDDFPPPSGGIITLADDTEYYLVNDIITSNRFIWGQNTVLSGADGTLITLEYTGTGTMITISDKDSKIKNIILSCPNGTLFDVSSTGGTHKFRFYVANVSCLNVGHFDNMGIIYFYNVNFISITGTGFTFSNAFSVVLLDTVGATMPVGTANNLFDMGTATFDYFTVDKGIFNINTTGYVITGLVNSGNINVGGLGVAINNRQFGTATPLNNISPYDDRWEFYLNPAVSDSHDMCLVTHAGTTITIGAAATPVIVGATWVTEVSHRFNTVVGGRWTYTGKGSHVDVTATITADIATGIDDVSFFLYKNGVQITNSQVTREFDSGDPGNLSLIWALDLATNDYLELWVQNDDAAVNVIIVGIVMRIGN